MSDTKQKHLVVVDRNYSARYFKSLVEFREAKRFTDIILRVDGEELVAHKAVLSAASPFFNAMFDDGFAESKQNAVDLLHDTSVAVMFAILDYVYSGKLTIAIKDVPLLLQNFDYLQMEGVKDECERVLLNNVTPENCIDLLTMADEINLSGLFEKAAEITVNEFERLYNLDELNELTLYQLETVLHIVHARHPDAAYKLILSWVKHDGENRGTHIHDLLSKYIKIANLSKDLIIRNVPKYILDDDFLKNSDGGSQWLLEAFFNVKQSRLYIFSTFPDSPVYAFEISSNSLAQLAKQSELNNFTAIKYKNFIYAVGGQVKGQFTDNGLRMDTKKKEWSSIVCPVRKNQCGVCIADDQMFIVGGWENGIASNGFSCYNFQTSRLATLPPTEFERWSPGVTYYNSSIYALGGHTIHLDSGPISIVERYDPREGKWAHAGQIVCNDSMGCTSALMSDLIYYKGWYSSLQFYDPRCLMADNVRQFDAFGTIASYDSHLYLAHEAGISEYIVDEEKLIDLFTSSFKIPFIVA